MACSYTEVEEERTYRDLRFPVVARGPRTMHRLAPAVRGGVGVDGFLLDVFIRGDGGIEGSLLNVLCGGEEADRFLFAVLEGVKVVSSKRRCLLGAGAVSSSLLT